MTEFSLLPPGVVSAPAGPVNPFPMDLGYDELEPAGGLPPLAKGNFGKSPGFVLWLRRNSLHKSFSDRKNHFIDSGWSKGDAWKLAATEHGWYVGFDVGLDAEEVAALAEEKRVTDPDQPVAVGDDPAVAPAGNEYTERMEASVLLPEGDVDLNRDVAWVYCNLASFQIASETSQKDLQLRILEQAPSGGARGMLAWAAGAPKEFFGPAIKMLRTDEAEEVRANRDDRRQKLNLVDQILEEAKRARNERRKNDSPVGD